MTTNATPRGRTGGGRVRMEGRAARSTTSSSSRNSSGSSGVFHSQVRRVGQEHDERGNKLQRCHLTRPPPFFFLFLFPGTMFFGTCRADLALLCAVLVAVASGRRSSPEQEDVEDKISSARCSSRCLTLHMTQLTAAFRHLQVRVSPRRLHASSQQSWKDV